MIDLKKWYIDTYKTDNMKKQITDGLTPESIINGCLSGIDIYELIGVGDSLIRERLFAKVSEYFGVTYNEIYDACIHQKLSDDLKDKIQEGE